jgi:hypothetical protein
LPERREKWSQNCHRVGNVIGLMITSRVGDIVKLVEGEHAGKRGTIRQVHLRHKFAYEIEDSGGAMFFAADEQIQQKFVAGSHTANS